LAKRTERSEPVRQEAGYLLLAVRIRYRTLSFGTEPKRSPPGGILDRPVGDDRVSFPSR